MMVANGYREEIVRGKVSVVVLANGDAPNQEFFCTLWLNGGETLAARPATRCRTLAGARRTAAAMLTAYAARLTYRASAHQ